MIVTQPIFQDRISNTELKMAINTKRSEFRVNTRKKLTDNLLQKSRARKLKYT